MAEEAKRDGAEGTGSGSGAAKTPEEVATATKTAYIKTVMDDFEEKGLTKETVANELGELYVQLQLSKAEHRKGVKWAYGLALGAGALAVASLAAIGAHYWGHNSDTRRIAIEAMDTYVIKSERVKFNPEDYGSADWKTATAQEPESADNVATYILRNARGLHAQGEQIQNRVDSVVDPLKSRVGNVETKQERLSQNLDQKASASSVAGLKKDVESLQTGVTTVKANADQNTRDNLTQAGEIGKLLTCCDYRAQVGGAVPDAEEQQRRDVPRFRSAYPTAGNPVGAEQQKDD